MIDDLNCSSVHASVRPSVRPPASLPACPPSVSPTGPPARHAIHLSVSVGVDYVPVDVLLRFAPGVKQGVARVRILDDLSSPRMEGVEKFELVLRLATGGRLVEPWTTVVAIDDVTSDGAFVNDY